MSPLLSVDQVKPCYLWRHVKGFIKIHVLIDIIHNGVPLTRQSHSLLTQCELFSMAITVAYERTWSEVVGKAVRWHGTKSTSCIHKKRISVIDRGTTCSTPWCSCYTQGMSHQRLLFWRASSQRRDVRTDQR